MLAFYMLASPVSSTTLLLALVCLPVMAVAALPRLATEVGEVTTGQWPTIKRLFWALSVAGTLAVLSVLWFAVECNWWMWIFCD